MRFIAYCLSFIILFSAPVFAQVEQASSPSEKTASTEQVQVTTGTDTLKQGAAEPASQAQSGQVGQPQEEAAAVDNLSVAQNVTLDFKEADIRNVLKIISYKAGVNIVTTPEVMGSVTVRLVDVPWQKALDAILKTYGYGYERQGNIITVAPIDKLTAMKEQELKLAQVQPTTTEVFTLKYIDAQDAKKALESQLSPRGKITILEITGRAGWEFGSEELGIRKRAGGGMVSRSKTVIISDIQPVMDKIREVISQIDINPQQIVIEAKLVEVNHDKLKDIGFTWGTGSDGLTALTTNRNTVDEYINTVNANGTITQTVLKEIVTLIPDALDSKGNAVMGANFLPAIKISEFLFQKLTGTEFEVLFKALETKGDANTLSAPHIMTLNNQEASILIGQKFPLIKSTISTQTGTITGQSLDKYQDIGIQLNVVPQISGKDNINLIIHPAVSSYTQTVQALSSTGQKMAEYPIILTREVDTQILIKDGETVAIGGLLTDAKTVNIVGVPWLKDIPIFGLLFQSRKTVATKVDLLMFITARIVKESDFSTAEIAKLKWRLKRDCKDNVLPEERK